MKSNAVERARRLLKKYNIEKLSDMDISNIVYGEGLYLKHGRLIGCEGKIVYEKGIGIITLNEDIDNEKHKRFIIAHEMGHYYNEKNKLRIENSELEKEKLRQKIRYEKVENFDPNVRNRRYGFQQFYGEDKKNREWEANEFASELLMPSKSVKEFIRGKRIGIELLEEVAEHYGVTITAAVLRTARFLTLPTTVIMSKNKRIEWQYMNKKFNRKQFLKGELIPFNTRAYNIFDKVMQTAYSYKKEVEKFGYKEALRRRDEWIADARSVKVINGKDWLFNDGADEDESYFYEANVSMLNFKSVLTILWEN